MHKGLTRTVDGMGRISIPSDFRHVTGIGPNTVVEVAIAEGGGLLITRHVSLCSICDTPIDRGNLGQFIKGKKVCKTCKEKLSRPWEGM